MVKRSMLLGLLAFASINCSKLLQVDVLFELIFCMITHSISLSTWQGSIVSLNFVFLPLENVCAIHLFFGLCCQRTARFPYDLCFIILHIEHMYGVIGVWLVVHALKNRRFFYRNKPHSLASHSKQKTNIKTLGHPKYRRCQKKVIKVPLVAILWESGSLQFETQNSSP